MTLDFSGDQREWMEKALNVSNSDTPSLVVVSVLGSGGLWVVKWVGGMSFLHWQKKASSGFNLTIFIFCFWILSTCPSLSSPPDPLLYHCCCHHKASGMQTDTHPLLKYYFTPPLNSQQCGKICLILHLHDFSVCNLWNDGNSTFLFLSQQLAKRKGATL